MDLMIPKINFRMNIYNFDSKLNDVDYNIEILKDSSVIDKLFFIVGHSGMGDNCYFNDIKKLEIGDYVYLDVDHEVCILITSITIGALFPLSIIIMLRHSRLLALHLIKLLINSTVF